VDPLPAAVGTVLVLVVFAATVVAVWQWSGRAGWDGRHRLGLAGGALLTYAWHSFTMEPITTEPTAFVFAGHVVFALAAVLLLVFEARRVWARSTGEAKQAAPVG
jgi:hypothetical protein